MRINRLFFSSVTISPLESVRCGDGSSFFPSEMVCSPFPVWSRQGGMPFLSLLIVFLVLRMKTDEADLKYDFLLRGSDIIIYICEMLAL